MGRQRKEEEGRGGKKKFSVSSVRRIQSDGQRYFRASSCFLFLSVSEKGGGMPLIKSWFSMVEATVAFGGIVALMKTLNLRIN